MKVYVSKISKATYGKEKFSLIATFRSSDEHELESIEHVMKVMKQNLEDELPTRAEIEAWEDEKSGSQGQ